MRITIKSDSINEEEIKKSRFICYLKRIENEEEAREFISAVKKEHWKANHNCSAYTLGEQQEIQRTSDDGEPSGTAGVPMLEILKKKQIINTCAVITRYFGGVKLGTGGLIRAYSGVLNHAIEVTGLVQRVEQQGLTLTLDYSLFDSLQHFLLAEHIEMANSKFLTEVKLDLFIDNDKLDGFISRINEKFSGKIKIKKTAKQLVEVALS
ncbi:YigZ family protein [Lactococcus nasutitermitis]|uniref:YigZ family protein n=1 Tax=Lactococcus nasutitermitis TaxID=1652957 RepID=A0ABV9JG75_9LACT|nr:YigZ family protein [Lactococcus nasutitermitis]